MNLPRCSGVLNHITSLPSRYGIGDLGPDAYRFADWLHHTGQRLWQVLPLVPVGYGYSPYASPSTFAGNPLMISPDVLREWGLLRDEDLQDVPDFDVHQVDFDAVIGYKDGLLRTTYDRFEAGEGQVGQEEVNQFCEHHSAWLDDYAEFMTLKAMHDEQAWTDWAPEYVQRRPDAMDALRRDQGREIHMRRFWQFLFYRQWQHLRAYCNERGIQIFGDLPIYVAEDSADVWSNPELFHLDEHGRPTVVAGVPPDYFSATGQRWGNPIYRWDTMKERGYEWWTRRFAATLQLVDLVRLDHFRGFEAYWEIPASEETAVQGRWVNGPGADLFDTLQHRLGDPLPVVAENLGVITQGVVDLMDRYTFPGMAILQFGFDGDVTDDFLPHNYPRHLVAYTGTHDNDTVVGWWHNNASTQDTEQFERARRFARAYLDIDDLGDLHWSFNRFLLASPADVAVMPLQDVLGLGTDARMNTPGRGTDNWAWRFTWEQVEQQATDRLKLMTEVYGRAENPNPSV